MTLPPSDAAGTLLGTRYRLDSLLGVGGMGQVHLAHDTVLERKVAIKMLPAEVAEQATARERFRREALAAAALDHPFICKIHEVGEDAGRTFIVMEYVEGHTLDRVARDGRLSPRQLIDCAHEIAQALDEAHRRGVVHRDLKPSNIMLTVHGHVKVLDFGLAKTGATGAAGTPGALGASAAGATSATGATSAGPDLAATALTDPGTRLGTPAYMSPEQVLGSPLDPRSDIFSLGTVLHEMTGCGHPFLKATAAETMASILRDPPAATAGDLDVVPGFGVVVHRMLAKACAERFQTMGELKAELDLLRDGSGSGTPASGLAAVRAEPAERTPFVARDAELTELTRALDRMLLGHGGIVLLGGEPGVGKTRLAREAQRLARARGCLVLTGQCYEHEGAPPFGPFAESIEQSLRMVPQAVRAVLGDLAPEVAMLAPALRRAFPDIPAPSVVPADQQRRVMFDVYTEYVRRATQKSAVVLLLDDLHWADESSLQLLLHLAPHLAALRVLAIGTYRDVELDTERPFARTLETLLRQRLATRITVKRLGASGVERMLATMSGAPPPSSLVRVVHEETDGNPFFVEEVFQHLAEEGRLFDEHGRWKADLRPDDIDVPEGVRLVISRRLERLGEDARRILTAAAVIGRSFSLDLLQAIVDASDDAVLDLVEQAERAHLLQAERGRDARYSFVHELIRSTLVSAMSLPRRQRLHAKIADALERLRSVTRDTHISMLAHHLYQAGAAVDAERTIGVLLTAMERSQAAGAFEETLVQVEQLLSLELAAGSAELAAVEETRAQALMGLRRLEEALQPASRAFEIWVARRHDAGIHRTAVVLANAAGWSQSLAPGARVLERALAALSPDALRERAALQTRYGTWIVNAGRLDEAIAAGEAGCRAAEALNDRLLLGDVYAMHSAMLRSLGRLDDAHAMVEQACIHLEGSRGWVEADARWGRLIGLYYTGRLDHLPAAIAENAALAERVGHTGALFLGRRTTAARDLIVSGDLVRFQADAMQELARPGNLQFRFIAGLQLAGASLCLGQVEDASGQLEAATGGENTVYAGLPAVMGFGVHAWSGAHDRARGQFPHVERHLARAGGLNSLGAWLGANIAAGALALMGERDACAALYPAIAEFIDLGHVVDAMSLGVNSASLSAAIAADAAGLSDRAAAHFAEAEAIAERLHSDALRPLVHLWHGRHLSQQGPTTRAEAEALLRDAAERFAALHMPFHDDLARRWLQDLATRVETP